MALSTTIKNKMLAVTHLQYREIVEIKNEDGDWIDFTGRDPRHPAIRLATEKGRHQVVSSVASVSFTNDDNYFDWMDDPSHLQTLAQFGTLATKFSKGFRGKQVRFTLRMQLPDGTHEDASIGLYRVRRKKIDPDSGRAVFDLWQDVDFLKRLGTEDVSSGKRHHENKPVSYLVREILKKFYRGGITASEFEIPDRIYLTTADGEPAFSHYGKPPEKDAAGRWRDDVTHKPTAMVWDEDNDYFVFGIMDEVWLFDPVTEEWEKLGEFDTENFYIRGFYKMDTNKYLCVGWQVDQRFRDARMETAEINTSAKTFTENTSDNDTIIYSGDFVLRDTYNDDGTLGLTQLKVGIVANSPRSITDHCSGVNMPCPLPHWPHSGCLDGAYPGAAIAQTTGLRSVPASGDWDDNFTSIPHGTDAMEPCYLVYDNVGVGTASCRPLFMVYWGMPLNLAYAETLEDFTGPLLFVVEQDQSPLGIRCAGDVQIVAYGAEDGTNFVVSENVQGGDKAPIYALRYFRTSADDYLFWIDVNWVEDYQSAGNQASIASPIWRIKGGQLTDNSGNPQLLDASISTYWTAGDDLFAVDDSEYAAIAVVPYHLGVTVLNARFLVILMDMNNMGGECFKMFTVNYNFSSVTACGTSIYGWASITPDASANRIYFIERDTGRVCYIDTSGTPTAYTAIEEGQEPVSNAFFEMPDGNALAIRTEETKTCIYGVSYPALPGMAYEDQVWINGKYYFWKHHFQITDRVELFEEDRQNAWEALGLLAQAVGYQVGFDPEGTGFFRVLPAASGASGFTIDLDSPIGRYFTAKKLDGLDDIINRSQFIPYESVAGIPEASLDLIGYIKDGAQVYFNGQTEIRSETLEEKNVTLHCIRGGPIGTAEFKYILHDFQVTTHLREDVNPGDLDLIRLDSNKDVEVDMLVQVGYYEGASNTLHVDVIEADGDIDLSEDLDRAYERGTPVTFRSAEHGVWSTEYDTPDTWTSSSAFSEIGTTGLFLKFTADASPINFAIGDRINVYNPGMGLQTSRTKKFTYEDSPSIETYEASEYKLDNPYISLVLGVQLITTLIDSDSDPHHGWEIDCPLFLQAKPHALFTVKSRRHLPTATDNEEKCYIKQVQHDKDKARTKIIARAVSAYV